MVELPVGLSIGIIFQSTMPPQAADRMTSGNVVEHDTIVAVVTPPGEGGVGIVRASGPGATSLPARLFPTLTSSWESHRLRQGTVVDPAGGTPLDEALGCLMPGPHSYTGE